MVNDTKPVGARLAREEAIRTTQLPIESLRPPAQQSREHAIDELYVEVQYGIISTKKAFPVSALSSVLPNQQQPARERT
jgi:hypothetical protein